MRAESKFGRGRGKGRSKGRGGKGLGRGRGRSARGRGAKGRGKKPAVPEEEGTEPSPVRRRLSFSNVEANASPQSQGGIGQLEGQAAGPDTQELFGDVAVEVVPGSLPPEPDLGDHGTASDSTHMESQQVPNEETEPMSVSESMMAVESFAVMEAPVEESAPSSAVAGAPSLDEAHGDIVATEQPSSSSGPKSFVTRGPKLHHTPPTLASIAPPGCSILLNSHLTLTQFNNFCFLNFVSWHQCQSKTMTVSFNLNFGHLSSNPKQ